MSEELSWMLRPGTHVSNLADILERDWQRTVIDLANLHGYVHYHTHRSFKSPTGFPDLVLVGRRVIAL